ncbi:GrpB family protein [Thalassobius sp. Cn5-15]|uniref:GrpB family protein n=1 Tax=Thalassobius sp. Cn5-15 TaxID=2917763 RepID=UPI001EF3B5CC|nr:GrpB family protein [Thalassobius sp. Cn5-15]MCG7493442.1 GrpB family protein [Thalassobius sp. Cn5-15]
MVHHVTPHDPAWAEAFATEAAALHAALPDVALTLYHIGSTAIPGILAKPIIDLMGVVPELAQIDRHDDAMQALGYEVMGAFGIDGRRYYRKFDANGQRSHHLHVFATGAPDITRHLAFRDYLRAHDDVATEYSALKAQLTAADTDWERYVEGKDPFIKRVEQDALRWYQARR